MAVSSNFVADRAVDTLSFILSIKPCLDDAHFQQMKTYLTKTGRGAPPKIRRGPLTHRLALQLELLRVEVNKTWRDMEVFFPKTVDGDPLQGLSLKTELEATVTEAAKVEKTDDAKFSNFLDLDIGAAIMSRNVGIHLLKHKITRKQLLNPQCLSDLQKPAELENGMVVNLKAFFNKEKEFTWLKMKHVLVFLGAEVSHLSEKQVSAKVHTVYGQYQSVNKNPKRPNFKTKMNLFLSSPAFTQQAAPVFAPSANINAWHSVESVKLATSERNQAKLRRDLEQAEHLLLLETDKTATLQEQIRLSNDQVLNLKKQIVEQQQDLELDKGHTQYRQLLAEQQATKQSLRQEQQTVRTIRATCVYKRLQRQRRDLEKKEAAVTGHDNGRYAAVTRKLRRKVKNLQTSLSNYRLEIQALRPLKKEVCELLKENGDFAQLLAERTQVTHISNSYSLPSGE